MTNHYKNLINYIDDLILDKAEKTPEGYFLQVDDLDDDELGNLANLFLEYDDRDTSDCFQEADKYAIDDNITCALLNMLKDNSEEAKQNFSELVRQNTIKRYRNRMQEYINERCGDVESDVMADEGLYKYQDRSTGEFHWRKSA